MRERRINITEGLDIKEQRNVQYQRDGYGGGLDMESSIEASRVRAFSFIFILT